MEGLRGIYKGMPLFAAMNHPDYEGPPSEGQCEVCRYWDISNSEVLAYAERRAAWDPRGAEYVKPNMNDTESHGVLVNAVLSIMRCRCPDAEVEKREQQAQRLAAAGLPLHNDSIGPRTFENFYDRMGTRAGRDAVMEWLAYKGPPVLVFRGLPGGGKSHLLKAAIRDATLTGSTSRYEYVPLLLNNRLLPRLDQESDNLDPQEYIEICLAVDFLGLDDVGREKVSEYTNASLG
ncbi:hypothetical protein LCGC14_2979440, partial [marine sediment metagenome]